MTTLYDLHIAVRASENGAGPVRLRLERREPYPPHPMRQGNELVLDDRAETLGQAETALPSNLLAAARLPAELADLAVLGDPQRRQLLSAPWPRESLLPPMEAIAQSLFHGPSAALLEEMQRGIVGSYGRYPWGAPDAVGRISLEVGHAALWRLPWELLLVESAWQGEPGLSCVVVRRERERAGTNTAPLTLPLTVSIYPAAADLRDQDGWGDGLFAGTVGDYARTARDMHGFEWQETTGLPSTGAVHHIVFSSDEGPGEISAGSLPDRQGRPVDLGRRRTPSGVERLATELQQYAARYEGRQPPRLLVLHNIAGQGTAGFRAALDAELLRRGLETGADAVWVVHCGTSDPAYGDLFPMFYRKVLHNWPLDQALLSALAQARSQGHEPLGWAFGARSGGELSVLLSEAVVAPTRRAGEALEVPKRCPKCGLQRVPEGASFCPRCGGKIPRSVSTIKQVSGGGTRVAGGKTGTRRGKAGGIKKAGGGLASARQKAGAVRVGGTVHGAKIDELAGGTASTSQKFGTVRKGRTVTGVKIGELGRGKAGAKQKIEEAANGGRAEIAQPRRARPSGPAARSERAAAELQSQLTEATRARESVLEEQANRLSRATFDEEEHSLAIMLEAQEQVQDARETDVASREALHKLAAMSAQKVEAGTVRLTHLSLTAGSDGKGRKVPSNEPLVTQSPYMLHVQIAPHVAEALVAEAFPDAALNTVFQRQPKVTLDVMVFAPASDFHIPQPRGTIELPRYGPSSELQTAVIPQRAGRRRLRVCLYYQNTMLQSLWMEATVVRPGEHAAGSFSATVDYVANADLALLDELPRPAVNLFTNETPQGDHWLGVFGTGDLSGFRLRSGDMYTLADFPASSKTLRDKLSNVRDEYRYEVELDAQGHLNVEAGTLEAYQKNLCELAKLGYDLFVALFTGEGAKLDRLAALGSQLQMSPALVSVARCRMDGTTFPWAALYGLDIDTGAGASLRLCPEFDKQLARNRWNKGLDSLLHKADLLDDPKRCNEQPSCPLKGAAQERTVCPFGFWGFKHQIEQPLQQVKPTPSNRVPREVASGGFSQTSLLSHRPGTPVHVAVGVYQDDLLQTDDHVQELEGLQRRGKVELTPQGAARANRDQLIAAMKKGGQEIYYFYCHGELEGGTIFKLKVGTGEGEGYIGAANLVGVQGSKVPRWKEDAPLVILNGCETVALLPERIHNFLGALRLAGASGVVGTEIEVFPGLARPFGLQMLRELLDGASLGEAFLAARLHLLRQYNPLGLAYSFYAPATLHLHDTKGCGWCKAHPPMRAASAPGG